MKSILKKIWDFFESEQARLITITGLLIGITSLTIGINSLRLQKKETKEEERRFQEQTKILIEDAERRTDEQTQTLMMVLTQTDSIKKNYERLGISPTKEDYEIFREEVIKRVNKIEKTLTYGFIEVAEERMNNTTLVVYTPKNAQMELTMGLPDKYDKNNIFVTEAALYYPNGKILGEFVMKGVQKARGTSVNGYCAVINGNIIIGFGKQTPLLQETIDNEGYFFRQYPLVNKGKLEKNTETGKALRKALAIRNNKIIMIESKSKLTFDEFANAMINIGVENAIYLTGGKTYGWYYDKEQKRTEFGVEEKNIPEEINYIVWRAIE